MILASSGWAQSGLTQSRMTRREEVSSWAWQKVLLSTLAGGALLPLSAMDLIRPSNVSACSAAVSIPTVSASIYVPVTPVRLVDTSSGLGFPPMGAGATSTL